MRIHLIADPTHKWDIGLFITVLADIGTPNHISILVGYSVDLNDRNDISVDSSYFRYVLDDHFTNSNDVIISAMASQITILTIVHSTFYSGADQRKHQSSASLAIVRWPVNSPHKMFPFDDVITVEAEIL